MLRELQPGDRVVIEATACAHAGPIGQKALGLMSALMMAVAWEHVEPEVPEAVHYHLLAKQGKSNGVESVTLVWRLLVPVYCLLSR